MISNIWYPFLLKKTQSLLASENLGRMEEDCVGNSNYFCTILSPASTRCYGSQDFVHIFSHFLTQPRLRNTSFIFSLKCKCLNIEEVNDSKDKNWPPSSVGIKIDDTLLGFNFNLNWHLINTLVWGSEGENISSRESTFQLKSNMKRVI